MNFARLTLSSQGIGNQLSSDQKDEGYVSEPLKEWSYYAKIFANDNTHLSAQFFLELAQVTLEYAKAIDVNDID